MADPRGFLNTGRETPKRRPVDVRIRDWKEVYEEQEFGALQKQAGRCMDCGIPFCHQGCPLGNLIPEWNDLIWRNEKVDAIDRVSIKIQSPSNRLNYVPLKRHSNRGM